MKRKQIIAGLLVLAVLMSSCKKKEKDPSSEKSSDISRTTETSESEDTEEDSSSTAVDFTKPDKDTLREISQRLDTDPGNYLRVMLNPRGEYDFDLPSNVNAPQSLIFEFQALEDPSLTKTQLDLSWYDQELIEALLEEAFERIEKDEKLVSEINATLERYSGSDTTMKYVRIVLTPNTGRSAYCTIFAFNDNEEIFKEGFFIALDGESPVVNFTSVNAGFASPLSSFAGLHKEDTVTACFSALLDAYQSSSDGTPLGQEDSEGRHWFDGKKDECISPAMGIPAPDPLENSEIILISDSLNRCSFYYLGNNEWLYSDLITNRARFTLDEETNRFLLDQLRSEAAISSITVNAYSEIRKLPDAFAVDWTSPYASSRLSDSQKNTNSQYSSAYIDQRRFQECIFTTSGDFLLYQESVREKTNMGSSDNPYYLDSDCYEYVTDGTDAYSRTDFTVVYYPADSFAGTYTPVPIGKLLSESGTFLGGYEAGSSSGKCSLELYDLSGATWYLVLTESGEIVSGWCAENSMLLVFTSLLNYDAEDPEADVKEVIEFAKNNTKSQKEKEAEDAKKTDAEWRKEDAIAAGFFDLGEDLIKGDEIDGSPVVESLISEVLSTKTYSIEFYSYGKYRLHEDKITADGQDYYSYHKTQSHDHSFDYDLTMVVIGDSIYQYSTDSDIMVFPRGEEYTAEDPLFSLPEIFQPTSSPKFHSAYKATMGGEEYVVEEWLERASLYTCFCKDGKLVAIKYMDQGSLYFGYFTRWENKADESLLASPN